MQFAGRAIDQGTRQGKTYKCHELQLSVVEEGRVFVIVTRRQLEEGLVFIHSRKYPATNRAAAAGAGRL